ncbi:MAG: glycoside hydrolase family 2 TIM barrel-domain containing protein [Planctomycetota bacterium]
MKKHLLGIPTFVLALVSLSCENAAPVRTSPHTALPVFQKEAPDASRWKIDLGGTWELRAPDSDAWTPILVPGFWNSAGADPKISMEWPNAFYRRSITLPPDASGTLLEFDSIRWGGEVRLNDISLGRHDLGYSGASFDGGTAVRPGENRLEIIPVGWKALPRHPTGDTMIPVGAANWFGMKQGGIPGEACLHLHRGAFLGAFRVTPHIAPASCDITAPVTAPREAFDGFVLAQILSADGAIALSSVQRQPLRIPAGGETVVTFKNIGIPRGPLWSPENPALLRACVWLEREGKTAAVRDDTFGLRTVTIRNGTFLLNEKPIALHGTTPVWIFNDFDLLRDTEALERLQVTRFRAMNARVFRSHQDPLPRRWLDVCDRNGILVVCEFPNFPDVQVRPSGTLESPYERPGYWDTFQREARGLIRDRANHPCIVMWSASNEGNGFGDWERENLEPFVRREDPTRPVLLSADVTRDVADTHSFLGNWFGSEGDFERYIRDVALAYPGRLSGCTEYGQFQTSAARYGTRAPEMKNSPEAAEDEAVLVMEQTEALRRARCRIIMPFCFPIKSEADWTPRPVYHALRNALAPLGVSLSLMERHARAGRSLFLPVAVMSDAGDASGAVRVETLLLDRHPGFDWNGSRRNVRVLAEAAGETAIAPWECKSLAMTIPLPDAPGDYTLAALLRRKGSTNMESISFRPLRTYGPLPAPAMPLVIGVLEKEPSGPIAAFLLRRGHRVVPYAGGDKPDVIIIGEGMLNSSLIRQTQYSMVQRVRHGTRLVLLEQGAWVPDVFEGGLLSDLATKGLSNTVASLFPDEFLKHAVGDASDFRRLNGVGGLGQRAALVPTASQGAGHAAFGNETANGKAPEANAANPAANPWKPLVFSYRNIKSPDWAVAYRRFEKGAVAACQIPLEERLNGATALLPDPVAERLLAFLMEENLPAEVMP